MQDSVIRVDNVGIHCQTGAGHLDIVGHNHIHVFLVQLGSRIFDQIFRFHRKAADKQLLRLVLADPAQNVIRAFQLN